MPTSRNKVAPIDIRELLPQREPIIMVDSLDEVGEGSAQTTLTLRPDNFFLSEGTLLEGGLVEHIAQSVLAATGYRLRMEGRKEAPLGYIGEVKRFRCLRFPKEGEVLTTEVEKMLDVGNISLIKGTVRAGTEVIAQTQMKIAVDE